MFRRYALLILGVFACSLSAIIIRTSHTQPFVLTAFRLTLAAILLTPTWLRERRRWGAAFDRTHLRRTLAPGLVLGAHLLTWTLGARITAVAQSTLIVNLVPVAIPFFLIALTGERLNRAEIAGTALAVAGLALITAHDAFSVTGNVWGNLVCLVSMLLFAWYLALGRRNRDFPSVWLYVVPIYAQAALVAGLVALPWLHTFQWSSPREWALIFASALGPTITGHSLLNASMRHFRGQIVSLFNVGQFAFAAAMAFVVFHEHPAPLFYGAAALAIAGVVIVVSAGPETATVP
jgi:drug/metabolite transporter (DMT)-like permease